VSTGPAWPTLRTPEANYLLSPAAVAQIRAALVAAVEHHGGSIEAEHEPGLDQYTRALEEQARAALATLDRAKPPAGPPSSTF
jgi:hypothetical protein